MGEQIPEAWLNFEKTLITARTKQSIIKWEELETYASESAIVDKFEVFFHYIIIIFFQKLFLTTFKPLYNLLDSYCIVISACSAHLLLVAFSAEPGRVVPA